MQVGKSFGKLESHEREKFENLNCNNVAKKLNPSCDDVRYYSAVRLCMVDGTVWHAGLASLNPTAITKAVPILYT